MVEVRLHVHGRTPVNELAASLSELDGVDAVLASDINAVHEHPGAAPEGGRYSLTAVR